MKILICYVYSNKFITVTSISNVKKKKMRKGVDPRD